MCDILHTVTGSWLDPIIQSEIMILTCPHLWHHPLFHCILVLFSLRKHDLHTWSTTAIMAFCILYSTSLVFRVNNILVSHPQPTLGAHGIDWVLWTPCWEVTLGIQCISVIHSDHPGHPKDWVCVANSMPRIYHELLMHISHPSKSYLGRPSIRWALSALPRICTGRPIYMR